MKLYKAFLHTVILVVFQILIVALITFILKQFNLLNDNNSYHILGLFRTVVQVAGYLLFFLLFWKPYSNWITINDLKIDNFKIVISILIIAIGYELFKSPFIDFSNIIQHFKGTDVTYSPNIFNGFDGEFIYRIAGSVLLAPLFEELFFRKYLITELIKKNSRNITLLTSSICFSLIHFETPNNLIPTFIFGLLSGLIYLKTQKIGYTILLHFTVNILWFLDVIFENKFYNFLFDLDFNATYWMLFILGLVLTSIGMKRILRKKAKHTIQ